MNGTKTSHDSSFVLKKSNTVNDELYPALPVEGEEMQKEQLFDRINEPISFLSNYSIQCTDNIRK